ncbi:nucleoid-associated protein [Pasteurella atlantica]|uniref:Nucleoid-associated protein n=2 Tax=Pasteurellaceae TaxID=712 RepID=A0ACC6HPP7_9PAST|nr:nucleoid-associated protein [Pasteurella atlantica]MDP8052759.1 nucleoid-associated protein [Pasteurella atlantica]MDP8106056.1 nucleoid-associated protein [Pasteurella atlantica]MDP8149437.1 nucleoid-associated protein [Pasteurella atlantica]
MQIESVVAHIVNKKTDETNNASVQLSEKELDKADDRVIEIINILDKSFTEKTLKRAKFSDGGFKEITDDFNSIDFMVLSKQLTIKLKDIITSSLKAKGGYLLFVKYITTHSFIGIFLVRNKKGSEFILNEDGSWNIDMNKHLDVENFAMGVKINLTILNDENLDSRYISLIKGNTDISQYFENWIGLDDSKEESKDANALYEIANNIDLPDDIQTRDELKKKIFDFAKGSKNKRVNLKELSQYLYGSVNVITDYAENNNIDVDGEFKLSGNNLRKFYKVSVRANNIELSAPRTSFNPEVIEILGSQIVIHSPELAEKLQLELDNTNDE